MILVIFSIATFQTALATEKSDQPYVIDDKLSVKVVFEGLKFPTSMAFLGPDDILALEKNDGTVQRIINGRCYLNHF